MDVTKFLSLILKNLELIAGSILTWLLPGLGVTVLGGRTFCNASILRGFGRICPDDIT